MNIWAFLISTGFFISIIRMTTPLLFGSMSSMFAEDSGVPNIGIEGIMLMSALVGVITSYLFDGNAWLGLLCTIIFGILMGLLLGFIVMKLKCDPTIAGIAYNLTGAGATVFVLYLFTGEKQFSTSLASGALPNIEIPFIKDIPWIGEVLSGHNILTYVIFLLIPVLSFVVFKTKFGMHLRSAGESPEALASVGVSVTKVRYIALALSGLFAAVGGAYMSMGYLTSFVAGMIAGRGFIALAATALGNRKPSLILCACLLFGVADAFAINPTVQQQLGFPTELIGCIPYVVTIVALVIYSYLQKKRQEQLHASLS